MTVTRLAFVQAEKVASSHDALNERWVPFAGPVDRRDPNVRYAVFTWDVFRQQWQRDGNGGFYSADLAHARADEAHRALMAKWQLAE